MQYETYQICIQRKTLQFENTLLQGNKSLSNSPGIGLAIVFTSVSLFLLGMKLFPSPNEKALYAEVEMLKSQIKTMDQDFEKLATLPHYTKKTTRFTD